MTTLESFWLIVHRRRIIQGVTDFYQNLSVQIERAHLNADNVILVGDFNAKQGPEIIAGDPHPMSSSGKLFYTKYNLHLLNSLVYALVF